MGRIRVAVILALVLLVVPVEVQVINGQNSPVPVQEQFVVQEVMYAFDGRGFLCSFNATTGCSVELDLSLSGDNRYKITLEIISNSHGLIFNFTTYGGREVTNFNQTVNLNYDDAYNITIAKHPFYSTVKINGIIDLYCKETTNSTVTPTYLPSSSPIPSPNTTSNTTPTPTPTVAVPEFPSWIILPLAIATTLMAIIIIKRSKKGEIAPFDTQVLVYVF
jgi:hypothetical protein